MYVLHLWASIGSSSTLASLRVSQFLYWFCCAFPTLEHYVVQNRHTEMILHVLTNTSVQLIFDGLVLHWSAFVNWLCHQALLKWFLGPHFHLMIIVREMLLQQRTRHSSWTQVQKGPVFCPTPMTGFTNTWELLMTMLAFCHFQGLLPVQLLLADWMPPPYKEMLPQIYICIGIYLLQITLYCTAFIVRGLRFAQGSSNVWKLR